MTVTIEDEQAVAQKKKFLLHVVHREADRGRGVLRSAPVIGDDVVAVDDTVATKFDISCGVAS